MKLLCKLFGHRTVRKTKFTPSIHARIVDRVEDHCHCSRCGKKWVDVWFDREKHEREMIALTDTAALERAAL